MKKLIPAFVLLFSSVMPAQLNDSLERLLAHSNDTAKVILLLKLSERFLEADVQQSLHYAHTALRLSEKMNFTNYRTLAMINVGSGYLRLKKNGLAESYFENAEKAMLECADAGIRRLVYEKLSAFYENKKDYRNAYKYHVLYAELKGESGNAGNIFPATKEIQAEKDKAADPPGFINTKSALFFVLILIVAVIVLFNYQRLKKTARQSIQQLDRQEALSRSVIETEEKGRLRIARELNEGIGQQLSAAKMNISALQAFLKDTNEKDRAILQNAANLLDDSVKEVRNVSYNMSPNVLVNSGLAAAVKDFIGHLSALEKPKINLEIVGTIKRFEQTKEAVLFRVLHELIMNVLKHADAGVVEIQIIKHDNELSILVEDNGVGFEADKAMEQDKGVGLKSIQSRVAFLKGKVFFDSRPGKGTTVSLEIPIP